MKRTPMRRRARLRAKKQLRRTKPLQRTASMVASERQRAAVAGRRCIVCAGEARIDPAHLISARRRDGASVLPARSLTDMSARGEVRSACRPSQAIGAARQQQWSAGSRPEPEARLGPGGSRVSGASSR